MNGQVQLANFVGAEDLSRRRRAEVRPGAGRDGVDAQNVGMGSVPKQPSNESMWPFSEARSIWAEVDLQAHAVVAHVLDGRLVVRRALPHEVTADHVWSPQA